MGSQGYRLCGKIGRKQMGKVKIHGVYVVLEIQRKKFGELVRCHWIGAVSETYLRIVPHSSRSHCLERPNNKSALITTKRTKKTGVSR